MPTVSVFLAHPLDGDPQLVFARAQAWVRWIERRHAASAVVVAPWLVGIEKLPGAVTDSEIHEAAVRRCIAIARLCDEVWLVGGHITDDMRRFAEAARLVFDVTELGPDAPKGSA